MADVFTAEKRSEVMGRIRAKDTRPELAVRKALHASGLRYRLHVRKLPGKPDIVLPKYRAVVLVQGCFWHGHHCGRARVPSSNEGYWVQKLTRNYARDKSNVAALENLGWRVFIVWECDVRSAVQRAVERLRAEIISCAKPGKAMSDGEAVETLDKVGDKREGDAPHLNPPPQGGGGEIARIVF